MRGLALEDPQWHAGLEQFDREFHAITDPLWERQYRNGSKGVPPGPDESDNCT